MLRFLRSLTAQILLVVVLFGLVGWQLYSRHRAQNTALAAPKPQARATSYKPLDDPKTTTGQKQGPAEAPQLSSSTQFITKTGNAITRLIVPAESPPTEEHRPPEIPKEVRERMLAQPEPLTLFTSAPKPTTPPSLSQDYAPYGRMIRCKLVTGLESSNLTTPLVAITLEDVSNRDTAGVPHLIIPAGIEVHGPAAARGRSRDRLDAAGQYIFVWRTNDENNGRELAVQGIALTRAVDPTNGAILPGDATGGIRGEVLETASNAEAKLFVASFLRAAASSGFQVNTSLNPLTNQSVNVATNSLRNAGLAGAQAVLEELATRMRKEIDENGYYVAVPAGREFYVYVSQTIDLRNARRGAFLAANPPANSTTAHNAAP